jgi:hypothetical protein
MNTTSTTDYEALAEEIREKRDYREAEDGTIYCNIRGCHGSIGLRCYRTQVPICQHCAIKTPVGYISREAAREQQNKFFTALPTDYLITAVVAFIMNLIFAFIGSLFGGIGFFAWILLFFWGTFSGGTISEGIWRVLRKRRGRYTGQVAAVAIILSSLLVFLFTFNLFGLLIYTAIVVVTINARFRMGISL